MPVESATNYASREALIRRYGWVTQHVAASEDGSRPDYCYTVGLHDQGWPELILLGVPMEHGHVMMRSLVTAMKALPDARQFLGRMQLEEWESPIYVLEPDQQAVAVGYAGMSALRSGGEARYLHVCLADPAGLFPWEHGFDRSLGNLIFLLGPTPVLH